MVFISVFSLLIAMLSLSVTFYNVMRTWDKQKFNISYRFLNCYFIPNKGFYSHFQIVNNSSEPISITGIFINEVLCDTDEKIIIKINDEPTLKTQSIPFLIESYGAKNFYCYFKKHENIYFYKNLNLEIRTSRGIVTAKIDTSNQFLLPITDLLNKY
ncbi:TPA: hypothetical protein O7I44_001081 [Staphylococcus aureus]|uniref:Uncharacterized protein n=3 Tax=Staphylococcus aureus TaxID=1280 RepID=A0A380DSU5_STAAU|nr:MULTISPECIES: hypothetical protein [Staphylococcus]EGS88525.1 hypothetical protein SA21269_0031 [Staphylococcus aureus subsp. aureus 21269]EWC65271.1 hypothetical protein W893_11375 [Staphylococcus aureus subsp. aureus ST 1413]VTS49533.1 Uncharacterised protein [Staphylococcus hyicus]AJP65709.1 hypothetical protein UG86_06510 [Staphylococcus aureus]ALO31342.1 hypothetical protein ASU36_03770 [Staphylococcus aureus]